MAGESVSSTKKSTDESVKIKVMFVVFFDWQSIVQHEFVPWSDGKQTVVPGSFSAFEGCCAQKEA